MTIEPPHFSYIIFCPQLVCLILLCTCFSSSLAGNVTTVDKDGKEVTLPPKTLEQAGFDKEPKLADRELPIDEFRYKDHSKIAYLEIMLKSTQYKKLASNGLRFTY